MICVIVKWTFNEIIKFYTYRLLNTSRLFGFMSKS